MKHIFRKMNLSIFMCALALLVCVTTTYAWYTNNTSVSVTNIKGTTKASSDNGLLISNKYDGVYSNTLKLETEDYTVNGTEMIPLQHIKNVGLTTLEDSTKAVDKSSNAYIQFSIFLKATSDSIGNPIPYLKTLTIKNAATTLPKTDVIVQDYDDTTTAEWTTDGGKTVEYYKVDAVRTLNFAISYIERTGTAANSETIGAVDYTVKNIVTPSTDEYGLGESANAIKYYEAVMNQKISKTPTTNYCNQRDLADENIMHKISIIPYIDKGKIYEVVFTFWMDGWDLYCFDGCKKQTFSIEFELTTVDDENIKVGVAD